MSLNKVDFTEPSRCKQTHEPIIVVEQDGTSRPTTSSTTAADKLIVRLSDETQITKTRPPSTGQRLDQLSSC